jgi:catalase
MSERAVSDSAKIVDAISSVFGKQIRNRAIHAKGIVLAGLFVPTRAALELSKAPHLQGPATEVVARFSNFSGDPNVADADPTASPRGLALRFRLPDGSLTDLVMHSFNGFPSATVEEFRQMLIALGHSGVGAPRPTPIELFLREHPMTQAFLEAPKPPPASYATLRYFGVNSFKFTNAGGRSRIGRYRIEPEAGERFLTREQLGDVGADYLRKEIGERVARAPIRFALRVQLATRDDRTEDPSIAWPESRETVEIGSFEIGKLVGFGDDIEGPLLFSPAALPDGIEPADPMIPVRDAAYAVSFERRHQR